MRYGKMVVLWWVIAAMLLSACAVDTATKVAPGEEVAPGESAGGEEYAEAPVEEEAGASGEEDAGAPAGGEKAEGSVAEEGGEAERSGGEEGIIGAVETPPPPAKPIEIRELEALQAGQSDDNLRFDAFQEFIEEVYPPHRELIEDRVVIQVVREDGSPVYGAVVAIEGQQGIELRTGSDGKAYLYPGLYGVEAPIRAQVRCPDGSFWQEGEAEPLPEQGYYGEELTVELGCERLAPVLLDVVYLHDVTGSMQDEMSQLQATTEQVMAMLEEEYGQSPRMIRVGGVLYRDRGDAFVTRVIDFDTPGGFSQRFQQFYANGGGDKPESVNAGLEDALRMGWRDDAIKVIVLVGDAAPHDYQDDPWDRYLNLSREAARQGVRLHAISASGMRDRGEVAWREMAVFTGGKFVFLTYESASESEPGGETTRHVEGYNVDDLGSIVFSLLKQEIENQR